MRVKRVTFSEAMRFAGHLPSPVDMTITIECRFFARFAELLGMETYRLELPCSATVADAVSALRVALERGDLLPETPLAAVNRAQVAPDHRLADGDELALLPPLAGG